VKESQYYKQKSAVAVGDPGPDDMRKDGENDMRFRAPKRGV